MFAKNTYLGEILIIGGSMFNRQCGDLNISELLQLVANIA